MEKKKYVVTVKDRRSAGLFTICHTRVINTCHEEYAKRIINKLVKMYANYKSFGVLVNCEGVTTMAKNYGEGER